MPLDHRLKWNAATHPGLKRSNNEDCFLGSPDTGLWLVADGMGGHEAGEVASAIVRDTLQAVAQQVESFSLQNAIQSAHQAILRAAEQGIGAAGMGSTVVALFSRGNHYQVAWVGDSRAYLWTPGAAAGSNLVRLTRDHSYVEMLFASGSITAAEIESHPDKHIITQCLGIQQTAGVTVDMVERQWLENQWVLLCSDGLNDELSDADIVTILAANNNSLAATDQLMTAALQHGGKDNITLQIIESPIGQEQQTESEATAEARPTMKWLYWLLSLTAAVAIALFIF